MIPPGRPLLFDEAVRPHIEYNRWIGRNRGKDQLFNNAENRTTNETAETVAAFIAGRKKGDGRDDRNRTPAFAGIHGG